jgi:AraC-like DNA-binding protein
VARCLQHHYQQIRLVIPSHCKSAGTLIAIGAHELAIGDLGELGPLDIQVWKPSELQERGSGLDIIQTLEAAQDHTREAFRKTLLEVRQAGRLSTKLAGDFASHVAAGIAAPLYSQIDPNRLGEMQRAMRIAYEYGMRLDRTSQSLRNGALLQLTSTYPSHSFVIDRKEAGELFNHVGHPTAEETTICRTLSLALNEESGRDPLFIRNGFQDQRGELHVQIACPSTTEQRGTREKLSADAGAPNDRGERVCPHSSRKPNFPDLSSTLMFYQEFLPHPALGSHVECLWVARAPALAAGRMHTHRVLPDNCVDILWQDGGGPGFAVGMMSGAILVSCERPVRTVAVRFKPGAAGLFLHLPLQALTDQRADIDQLWGRSDAERLADGLWSVDLPERARLDLIEAELIRRLWAVQRDGERDGLAPTVGALLVGRALAAIDASNGTLRIDQLASNLGVSRQHFAAQFRQRVGLTPKLYARISRFRRATALLRQPSTSNSGSTDWAQLALECGYFDQSHLIHDFQEFAGSAPQQFLQTA